MREFKKATNEFKETIQIDEDLSDVKKAFDGLGEDIKDAVSPKKDTAEFKRPDEPKSAEGAVTEDKADKLENVKKALDELKATDRAASGDESERNAETEKKKPHRGSGKNDR
jgi:sec-independent protein translocase protein TatB